MAFTAGDFGLVTDGLAFVLGVGVIEGDETNAGEGGGA